MYQYHEIKKKIHFLNVDPFLNILIYNYLQRTNLIHFVEFT